MQIVQNIIDLNNTLKSSKKEEKKDPDIQRAKKVNKKLLG